MIIAPPVGDFTCSNTSLPKCDKNCPGHEFDHSVWEKTIIHEWDLVCDKAYLPSIIQSIMMFGIFIGNIVFGYLADRFGRRGSLTFCVMLHLIAGIVAAFSRWLWLHTFLRFLCNVGVGGTIVIGFSIIMEFIDKKYRTVVSTAQGLPSQLAVVLLGPIGYFGKRWDHIQLMVSVPTISMLSYWCFLPESPRWLLTMRKGETLIKTLEIAAQCNKLPTEHIRPQVEEYLRQDLTHELHKGGNIVDLFHTRRMRIKTIVLCIIWMILSMSFFCIMLYIGQIGGNIFINISTAGALQMVANIFLCFLINKINRKICLIISYIICSISMFIISIIHALVEEPELIIQIMSCIGLMGISTGFRTMFVFSGELYPTMVRTVGMGVASMCARIGSMISPFLMITEKFGKWMPPFLFGIYPAAATLLIIFFLPETRGVSLPDTMEEADEI